MEEVQKELLELKVVAQAVVDLVDSVEEGAPASKTLVECLCEAPQKFSGYLTESSKQCVAYTLGLVKSYWPGAKIALLCDGMSNKCDEDKFTKYVEEAEPVVM